MRDVPALTHPLLDVAGVRHAFFTRQGGVSEGIYASLNVGSGSKDDPAAVRENRRRAAAHLGGGPLVTGYQVHSPDALAVTGAWPGEAPQCDGVATATRGVICGALAADCAPILFADPEARVVAACHAGWKGALHGVAEDTLKRMEELGAQRDRIRAVIGPCIGPASYEVGLEYVARFTEVDPAYGRFFTPGASADKRQFDLPAFVLFQLEKSGIEQRAWIGRDTCAEGDLFFSNRRAFKQGEPDYGRLLSAIALEA